MYFFLIYKFYNIKYGKQSYANENHAPLEIKNKDDWIYDGHYHLKFQLGVYILTFNNIIITRESTLVERNLPFPLNPEPNI